MSLREYLELGIFSILTLALCAWAMHAGSGWGKFPEQLRRLVPHGRWSLLAAAAVGFFLSALLCWVRPPAPGIHDEFSYLLAADTFASGRLTNPTHPMWEHFESYHIFQHPTYQSKYPPGQGLLLALGQSLGEPLIGVWLSAAIACASLLWMLQAWVPAPWAWIGAVLPFIRTGVFRGFGPESFYWSRSYWGAWLAVAGGALLYGGLRRVMRRLNVRDSSLLAVGLIILANTRPFIGLLASLPAAVVLLAALLRRRPAPPAVWFRRVAAPVTAWLAVAAIAMGYYNYRVTGDPLLLPYIVHERQYQAASHLILAESAENLESTGGVETWHDKRRRYYGAWRDQRAATLRTQPWGRLDDFLSLGRFFLGPALAVSLLALPWLWNRRGVRMAFVVLAFAGAGYTMTLAGLGSPLPHYVSPAVPLLFLIVVQLLRGLAAVRAAGRPLGRALVAGVLITCAVSFLIALASNRRQVGDDRNSFDGRRQQVLRKLENLPGRHLVIVRYDPEHNLHEEWVYNRAGIDAAKVVWAHDLDPGKNRRLLEYFHDRQVWLIEADEASPRLRPYPRPPEPEKRNP